MRKLPWLDLSISGIEIFISLPNQKLWTSKVSKKTSETEVDTHYDVIGCTKKFLQSREVGKSKHLRNQQNASFWRLPTFYGKIQDPFIHLRHILDLLEWKFWKVQNGSIFHKKFRITRFQHLQFLLDSNFEALSSNDLTPKTTTYRHPYALSFFAKSVFAKSLAKRAESIGIGNA